MYHAWPVLPRMPVSVEDVKVYIYFGKSEYDHNKRRIYEGTSDTQAFL